MTGLTARYDKLHARVDLCFGESVITSWSVPPGEDLGVKWRRDRFVAERLRVVLEQVEDAD